MLWLLLLTGEMMKWAHLSTYQENAIAAAQLTLTSGVAGVVMIVVFIGLARKTVEMYKKYRPVGYPSHPCSSIDVCHGDRCAEIAGKVPDPKGATADVRESLDLV